MQTSTGKVVKSAKPYKLSCGSGQNIQIDLPDGCNSQHKKTPGSHLTSITTSSSNWKRPFQLLRPTHHVPLSQRKLRKKIEKNNLWTAVAKTFEQKKSKILVDPTSLSLHAGLTIIPRTRFQTTPVTRTEEPAIKRE